jgi:hypothetical protein
MEPTFFGYWTGELPAVTELHFRSFVHHHPNGRYELWLDEDGPSRISAPSLQWILSHPAIRVRPFSLNRLIEAHVSARPVAAYERAAGLKRLARQLHRKLAPVIGPGRAWQHPLFGLTHRHSSLVFPGFVGNKAYRGDLARCLIPLAHYPGRSLYVDLDLCFMSPLGDLCGDQGFTYRWETHDFANSAVLYLPDAGWAQRLLDLGRQRECFLPWILFTLDSCRDLGLRVYDAPVFDPLWDPASLLHGEPARFFEARPQLQADLSRLRAEGHRAIHWHNNWRTVPAADSLYAALLQACAPKAAG